ncbi:MAG: HAMP domain-containing histidine kinase [Deltaproteobacteria bacterium]|nr:HAMP domain-containing histidine kinase [Deltaproteobacteria bacterium]
MEASEKLRCSSRIASALLDALAATGDVAGLNRVRRVYDQDWVNARAGGTWVSRRILDDAFRAAGRDRNFARRVGYALVAGERVGFFLFLDGVATIDKAYRRCEPMLAREDPDGRFHALEVGDGRARVAYHPGQGIDPKRGKADRREWNTSFCGVRQGMLEALPLSFGMLPAKVEESQCVGDGASHCCFEVHFDRRSNRGVLAGMVVGAATAVGLCGLLLADAQLWAQAVVAGVVTLLSMAAGHGVDLAKQLAAVAGARRGHLALLEQADRALAEKMDELAKIGSHLESSSDGAEHDREVATRPRDAAGNDHAQRSVHAAEQIYRALGPLQRGLQQLHRVLVDREQEPSENAGQGLDTVRQCVDQARLIQSVGAELARARSGSERSYEPVQLAEVVARAADCVRPQLLPDQELFLDLESGLAPVRCEPFQMEQVAYQLLCNAAQASPPDGTIRARLCSTPGGIELTIEDRGGGIPDEIVEKGLDPFAVDSKIGDEGGLELAICYRIVVQHGGEMRIATDPGDGTRITVALPADLVGDA